MIYKMDVEVKLAYKEQPFFYNRSTANFHLFATDEYTNIKPYVHATMLSIYDASWDADADLESSFDEQFFDELFELYLAQIPETGATRENFKDFFESYGFEFSIW